MIPRGSLYWNNANQSPTGDTDLGKGKLTFSTIHLVTNRAFGVLYQAYKGRGRVHDPDWAENRYIGVDEPRRSHYQPSGMDNPG